MFHAIRQLEEKNVGNEIDILLWSDRMDLVAFSNIKGEVALHRLSWVRAWSLSPPKEGLSVKGMAWRPDGKVLAIAYSSGEIHLINVENKSTLHKIEIEENISCIFWIREKVESKSNAANLASTDDDESTDYMKNLDYSSKYLPDLPPLSSLGPSVANSQDENSNSNLFHDQKELNLLMVGTQSGLLHISIFGQFPCAVLDLENYVGYKCSVISAHSSDDLSLMFVTIRDDSNNVKIALLNTSIFKTHSKELFAVALKHGHLNSLLTYLSNVIVPIKETWETILLEMDAKLSKYASKVPEGALTADFLDLLMFGITSDEMQEFLLQDLTEKGLKKFGQIIEVCYANIQKLLLKHITKAGQNLTFHLAELRGMARLEHRYTTVGLSEDTITEAIGATGAFLTKGGEMHQIINQFMINYKAFFRWLYIAILHLMDIPMMPDMPKNTQQDVAHIMEFILNFDNIGGKGSDGSAAKKQQFIMEKLGQYLNDSPLTIPPDIDGNLWESFLAQNECIRGHPSIIRRYKNYSLIQQFKHLAVSIENIFVIPKDLIVDRFSLNCTMNCLSFEQKQLHITKINYNSDTTLVAFVNNSLPTDGIYFCEITNVGSVGFNTNCAYVYFKQNDSPGENYFVSDIKFYSPNILSVLLQENSPHRTGILYQFSMTPIRDRLIRIDASRKLDEQPVPKMNGLDLGFGVLKHIEGMACSRFSVSGCRRVSVVLSENRKKVRLFEMEAEEDDEEDADMTNSARESDTSMQEESSFVE